MSGGASVAAGKMTVMTGAGICTGDHTLDRGAIVTAPAFLQSSVAVGFDFLDWHDPARTFDGCPRSSGLPQWAGLSGINPYFTRESASMYPHRPHALSNPAVTPEYGFPAEGRTEPASDRIRSIPR